MSDTQAEINHWVKAISREKKKAEALEGMVVRLSDDVFNLRKAIRKFYTEKSESEGWTSAAEDKLMEATLHD